MEVDQKRSKLEKCLRAEVRENILHKYVNPVYISLFVYQNDRYHVKSSFSPFFLQKSYLFMQIVRIWIRQGRCEESLFEIADQFMHATDKFTN